MIIFDCGSILFSLTFGLLANDYYFFFPLVSPRLLRFNNIGELAFAIRVTRQVSKTWKFTISTDTQPVFGQIELLQVSLHRQCTNARFSLISRRTIKYLRNDYRHRVKHLL